MERQRYCVYNHTSECFLSMGASLAADAFGHLGQMLGQVFRPRPKASDEGQWVLEPKPIHTLRLFSSRDLILLDEKCAVLEAIESWPSFRIRRLREDVASVLILPLHTIYSSQTLPGHRLIISLPEEMRVKLRDIPAAAPEEPALSPAEVVSSAKNAPTPVSPSHHREPPVLEEPKLVAYDSSDAGLRMYGIKDASPTGLFLITDERWPRGTQVALTVQRIDNASDSLQLPVTVEMSVAQWGGDGMAFTLVRPGALDPLLTEVIGS